MEYCQQALTIAQEIGDRRLEARVLANSGKVYAAQDRNAEAVNALQQSVAVIESVQGALKTDVLKASFAADQADVYQRLIGLLWDAGQYESAFNYAERARARAFLDTLANGVVDFRAGVSVKLLDNEKLLKSELAGLRQQLVLLKNRPTNEWDTETIQAVEADLSAHEADYAQLLTDLKLQSKEVASLVSVDVASLADVQALLDDDTTLLDYVVTDDRVLAFIITRNSFETAASVVSREELASAIEKFRAFANRDETPPPELPQLYNWLIAPLKVKLKTRTVGLIPHGVLHYVPFAALTADGQSYLSDAHVLFTLPSASVLPFIISKRKATGDAALILGNPLTTEPGLAPLAFAQQEAEMVAGLYGTAPLIGDAATESALQAQASGASILHIGAHGEYNASNPLFSAIYLAGDDKNDGRLETHEIYGLDLTQATSLVVLSACRTQVGTVSAGDEVVSLNRAFLFAGTPTVIASLWNVDDTATSLLMERFYTYLRQGQSKGEALRLAQVDVREQFPHPYYWAAFVLTGDPGVSTTSSPIGGFLCTIAALLIGLVILVLGIRALGKRRQQKR